MWGIEYHPQLSSHFICTCTCKEVGRCSGTVDIIGVSHVFMFANYALLGGGVRVREQSKIKRRSKALLSLWWHYCVLILCWHHHRWSLAFVSGSSTSIPSLTLWWNSSSMHIVIMLSLRVLLLLNIGYALDRTPACSIFMLWFIASLKFSG